MDNKELSKICENEDIQQLENMVTNGFPLYLHLHELFEMVMDLELTKLFNYIVKYIKHHHLNQLLHGAMYTEYIKKIRSYSLFLLLKYDQDENKIHSFMSDVYDSSDEHATIRGCLSESALIPKIITLNLPDNIINIFKNYKISSEPEKENTNTAVILNIHAPIHITKHFWKSWQLLKPDTKDEVLGILAPMCRANDEDLNPILISIIRAGLKDLYFEMINRNKYNMRCEIYEYTISCELNDFDFSLKILMRVVEGTDIKTLEQLRANKTVRNRLLQPHGGGFYASRDFTRRYYAAALEKAFICKNHQLIELNEFILNECYDSYKNPQADTTTDEYKSLFSAESFIAERGDISEWMSYKLLRTINDLYETPSYYWVYRTFNPQWSETLDNVMTLVKFAHEKEYAIALTSPNFVGMMVIYYLMSSGYKDMFKRITCYKNSDDETPTNVEPEYVEMIKYFDKQNAELTKVFIPTEVLTKDTKGVVLGYAVY